MERTHPIQTIIRFWHRFLAKQQYNAMATNLLVVHKRSYHKEIQPPGIMQTFLSNSLFFPPIFPEKPWLSVTRFASKKGTARTNTTWVFIPSRLEKDGSGQSVFRSTSLQFAWVQGFSLLFLFIENKACTFNFRY